MPIVNTKIVSDKLRIYIDDFIHISISLTDLVGIQSYSYKGNRWYIDFYTKTTKIECWYTNKQIWEDILKQIDQIDLV